MAITNAKITTSSAAIYTSPSNTSNAITTVIICNRKVFDPLNPTDNTAKLSLYAVPSGGSATSPAIETIIVNELVIPAGETVTFDQEKMVLADGDMLVAKADVGSTGDPTLVATVSTLVV